MEKPYLNNSTKLDEQALRKVFIYNLNKTQPILTYMINQLPCLAHESCFGDLENAIMELAGEVKMQAGRIVNIFEELNEIPDPEDNPAVNNTLKILFLDKKDHLNNLSKDLHLVFHIQRILNIKRNYYSILKSIAGSLNNIGIKQYLQCNYDECGSNQLMFKLIAKEYMDTSINTFLV